MRNLIHSLIFCFCYFFSARQIFAADSTRYFLIDGGLGISPHSLLGGSYGIPIGNTISLELGVGIIGSRANILGPSFTSILTKEIPNSKFSFLFGNVLYSGKGVRTIVFTQSCDSSDEGPDTRCKERTHELHVPADRKAEWTYAYWVAGTRLYFDDSSGGSYWDFGLTKCWYGKLHVSNAPND